jgi:hypothetical protein
VIPGSESHVNRHRRTLAEFFKLQRSVILPEGSTTIDRFSMERWNRELSVIVATLAIPTARAFGREIAERYRVTIDVADLDAFLRPYARITAENTNQTTADALEEALASDEDTRTAAEHVFTVAIASRALSIAQSKVTTEANLGRDYAATVADVKEKRWVVTSNNPRSSHARLNGETVRMSETFSNGGKWPGDPSLPVDERAGCSCLVEFDA